MKLNLISLWIAVAAAAGLMFTGCSGNTEWKVKGSVDNAEGKFMVLEASNNGFWYMLDSLTLGKNGKFNFKQPATGFPDVYRLTIDGNSIYFPIDSIETIIVKADAANFASAKIEGSQYADDFMEIDALIAAANVDAANDTTLKRQLAELILRDPAGISAYYVLNKKVGDKPLYNASNKNDLRMIGAVANAFTVMRPNDPRSAYLKNLYLTNRPVTGQSDQAVVANQVSLFDIDLLDKTGKRVSLLDVAKKGNVVILSFTALTADESPAFNSILGDVYAASHNRGLEIYQVSFDADEFAWKQSAKNIPWISVYNGVNDGKALRNYNVGSLPALFIIDRNGNLVERVTNLQDLQALVNKYL